MAIKFTQVRRVQLDPQENLSSRIALSPKSAVQAILPSPRLPKNRGHLTPSTSRAKGRP